MGRRNGFTLVELLAIIVILGVIAVIVIPKIVDTVENAKVDSVAVSAKGFSEAITKYYMENNKTSYQDMVNENYGLKMTGSYVVSNGHITRGDDDFLIPINGAIPTSGNLEIVSGVVVSGCLTIGKYSAIIQNSNVVDSVKGDCENAYSGDIESLPGDEKDDGYKYLDTPIVVYYDPVTGKTCSSATGGCMKWYAYSIKDGIVNLILDHNINTESMIPWIIESDYNNSTVLGSKLGVSNMGTTYSFPELGIYDRGPLTTLNYLKNATSSWMTSVLGDYKIYNANVLMSSDPEYHVNFRINYSNYSARLLTAQEIAYIVDSDWDETTDTSTIEDLPGFLYDNLGACTGETTIDDTCYGYWTSSPVPAASDGASGVYGDGVRHGFQLTTAHGGHIGIRPVISLYFGVIKEFVS